MNWHFFSYSQSHTGKVRAYNEDACLDCPHEGVWVVADGMGGHKAGDVASQMLVDIVRQYVKALPKSSLSVGYLERAIQDANRQIYDYSQRYFQGETVGTTVVLLFVQNGEYHCLWVGDSRLYMQRQQQLAQKTRDHSQVMDMVEQGLIAASEAEHHPMANVITRAVGVALDVEIDQVSGQLEWGDQFLLCSDGLTKELPDNHIAHCLQAQQVTDAGMALMHSALVRGATDNVTYVLVKAAQMDVEDTVSHSEDDTIPIFVGNNR
ncbi:Stp1/IreP family PP2C-type Ser/Thr phosphatase [Photobacterium nomapromontoriensis]|uniref:Stp1/IreP family PP2C-type Ser/Thr phosphatase n=1 Tax=Photobacterium nomapromontoriensis TaxID=2910237 RepID=UPI003D0FF537